MDSSSRAGAGDLKNNQPANSAVDMLNNACPAWLGIAHTPRADESHIFGSTFFEAGADIMVKLASERSSATQMGISLQITKANDFGIPSPEAFRFTFDEWGLKGAVRAKVSDFPVLYAGQAVTPVQEIINYLRNEKGEASATEIADALKKNRSFVSRVLNDDKRFVKLRRGQEVLYGYQQPFSSENN